MNPVYQFGLVSLFLNVTVRNISVIHVTYMFRWLKKVDLPLGSNAIDRLIGFLNMLVLALTQDQPSTALLRERTPSIMQWNLNLQPDFLAVSQD